MNRMRTIDQAAAYIKQRDPGTALSKWAIRNLVLTGVIPHVAVGTKRLIALESLESYLAQTPVEPLFGSSDESKDTA